MPRDKTSGRRAAKTEGLRDDWEGYTWGDSNASRDAMPGTKPQVLAETFVLSVSGKPVGKATMNYDGLAGGLPTRSRKQMKANAENAARSGATKSAKASATRQKNIEGHKKLTDKSKSEIHRRVTTARRKKSRGK